MDKDFFDVPEGLWKRIEPLVPRERPKPRGGRPRVPDRMAMAGILYRVRTGCQWKALPPEFGSGSTCHLRMMQWVRAGVFVKMHAALLRHYDKRRGIKWDFASLDSTMAKAPKGGRHGAEPDGSRETRGETPRPHGWTRRAIGRPDHRSQRARQVDGGRRARRGRAPSPAGTTTPRASLPGQGLRLCRRGSRRAPSGDHPAHPVLRRQVWDLEEAGRG